MIPNQSFRYGEDRIEYAVFFTPLQRGRIAIHVHPDASVQIDAPPGETIVKIHRAVLKRARWIRDRVSEAKRQRRHVLTRTYVSGESLYYLGRRYQLKVTGRNKTVPSVKLLRGRICVEVPSKDPALVRKRLAEWYRNRAADIFERRLVEIADRVRWLAEAPDWRIVTMRKQWGSCSPAGMILLNPHLVKAPRECVDYVISHELCHLREHNHSPRYYRLLGQVMPGWESIKRRLDGMAEMLLNE